MAWSNVNLPIADDAIKEMEGKKVWQPIKADYVVDCTKIR